MSNRTILITGAGGGIAKEQVKAFLKQGDQVIGFDVAEEPLNDLNAEVTDLEGELTTYVVDIANEEQVTQTMEKIWAEGKAVDILINTAGVFDQYQSFLEMTTDTWDNIFAVNVRGMFLLSQAVAEKMVERGHGVIINIASAAGLRQDGGGAAYTASKHAVVGLTKRMSFELGEKGVRVNAIAPGRTTTDMNAKTDDLIKEDLPAQRNGTTEDIANLTLFLASDKAAYIHGQIISIDGGWTIM
jgi:3-oxoacyl-[acyl-carrier protein] reductase